MLKKTYHKSKRKLFGSSIVLILLAFSTAVTPVFGQQSVKELRAGNSLYDKGNYKAAEINYRKSLEQQNNYAKAMFNLGDALYKQQKYEEAAKVFQTLTESDISKDMAAQAYHNLGNCLLQQKKYQESIDAYKNSLKQKPNDLETKYNLEYAKKKIIQQQQQQQQNKQNQQKQDQQKQDQPKQDQQKKDQQKQNQQNQISKEDAIKNSKTLGDIIDKFTIIYKDIQEDLKTQIVANKYNIL